MVEIIQREVERQGWSSYKRGIKFDDSVRIYAAGPQNHSEQFLWLCDEKGSEMVFNGNGSYGDISRFQHNK